MWDPGWPLPSCSLLSLLVDCESGRNEEKLAACLAGTGLVLVSRDIVVSPLLVTYFKNPEVFFHRMEEVSIFNDVERQNSYQPLVDNLIGHLKFFHQAGDNNGRHNLPGDRSWIRLLACCSSLALVTASFGSGIRAVGCCGYG